MSDNANAASAPPAASAASSAPSDKGGEQQKVYFSGIVKSVLDGGSVVIRGQPRNGPPPERILAIAEIEAPRVARRPNNKDPAGSPDQPYAWEAREFLRKLLVGKPVLGTVTYTTPGGREYGTLLYGSNDPTKAENAGLKLVEEGLVKVRALAWASKETALATILLIFR